MAGRRTFSKRGASPPLQEACKNLQVVLVAHLGDIAPLYRLLDCATGLGAVEAVLVAAAAHDLEKLGVVPAELFRGERRRLKLSEAGRVCRIPAEGHLEEADG